MSDRKEPTDAVVIIATARSIKVVHQPTVNHLREFSIFYSVVEQPRAVTSKTTLQQHTIEKLFKIL